MKGKIRKIISIILAIIMVMAYMPAMAFAADTQSRTSGTCGDNVRWELSDSGELTISGTGAIEGSQSWIRDRIKSVIIEEGVTSIDDNAFDSCKSLTEITIPKGVTSIGDRAFYNCKSLTEITIPEGVTFIGYLAFYNCKSLAEITIPASVTEIGEDREIGEEYNFSDCKNITYKGTSADVISKLLNRLADKSRTTTSVTLGWNKLTKASSYKVYRYSDLTRKWICVKTITNPLTNSCTVTGLKPGNNYTIKVTSTVNGKTYTSEEGWFYTYKAKPSKVTNVKLTTGAAHYVNATWNYVNNAEGYQIQIATNSTFTKNKKEGTYYSGSLRNKKFTKLTKGKTYYVRVRALNFKDSAAYKATKPQFGSWSTIQKIVCK